MVLNINRESMATVGFSPPTRVFEAAGSAACVITDEWAGIETFFTPGSEILTAASAEDVVAHLRTVGPASARKIGKAMLERALKEHTYRLRAHQLDAVLQPAAARLEVPA
jgi:spore maturation protein CgeB